MAAAADLTVKKFDGVTDIVWTVVSASGGDKSPALWRSNTASGTFGQRPTFWVAARPNAAGDVRRVDVSAKFPSIYTNSSTGQTELRSTATFTGSFAVPQNMTTVDIQEFAYQIPNLIAATLIKGTIVNGYSPT